MKYDTYVASGYKFGLMNRNGHYLLPSVKKLINGGQENTNSSLPKEGAILLSDPVSTKFIVPFESVDGLSLAELRDYPELLFKNQYLVFLMYDALPIYNEGDGVCEEARARYALVIDTLKNKDCSIDEVVEDYLARNIHQMNPAIQKRALSFLGQYIVDSRSDVNDIVYHTTKEFLQMNSRLRIKNNRK